MQVKQNHGSGPEQDRSDIRALVDGWSKDEILPVPYLPDGHPLTKIVEVCCAVAQEQQDRLGPDYNLSWVAATQEVQIAPPGICTSCMFEIDGADADKRERVRIMLDAQIDELLRIPNLSVQVVSRGLFRQD